MSKDTIFINTKQILANENMKIDNFIDETKAEQLTKLMAETLVNAEGIANLAYLWDLEDT